MDEITLVLKKLANITPSGWSFLSFLLWRGISNFFHYLITKEEEKTKRLEIKSNEVIRILEIHDHKEIELIKEANRHKEFKISTKQL